MSEKLSRRKFLELVGTFSTAFIIGEEIATTVDSYEYFKLAEKSLLPVSEKHDVAVLLTGSYFSSRIKKAKEILKEKLAEKIIISGYETSIKHVKELLEKEFPKDKILLEQYSKNTIDNAYFVYSLYGDAYNSLLLVTSQPHQPRAYFLFDRIHPESYTITPVASAPYFYEDLEFTFKEIVKYSLTKQIFANVAKGDIKAYATRRKLIRSLFG